MARCRTCGKRLFPIINNRWCGPCLEARSRADADDRYRAACAKRDKLNSRAVPVRVFAGAWRGALYGVGVVLGTLLALALLFSDGPGEPRWLPDKRRHWRLLGRWLLLSALGIGALWVSNQLAPWSGAVQGMLATPLLAAAALGALFGAWRGVAREWGWWFDLEPPEPAPTPKA